MRLRSLASTASLAAALVTAVTAAASPAIVGAATPSADPALAPIVAPAPPDLRTSVTAARAMHVFPMVEGAFTPATRAGIDNEPVRFVGIAATDDGSARQAIVLGIDSATAGQFTGYAITADPLRLSERAAGSISGTREHGTCNVRAVLLASLLTIDLAGPCTATVMRGTFTARSAGRQYSGTYLLQVERDRPAATSRRR